MRASIVNGEIQCEPCEVSAEAMKVRKSVDPKRPSQQEVVYYYRTTFHFEIVVPIACVVKLKN